jgi:predicted amidophosphoribosyltransferase
MRNVQPAGPGICATCHTFVNTDYDRCWSCSQQPAQLDAVVPITYSEHLGQIHTVLRGYKDGTTQNRRYMIPRLAAILWMFIERHERCIAAEAGATSDAFDVVTTVPSSTPERDEARGNLRLIAELCTPISARFERLLVPTGEVPPGRTYNARRFVCNEDLADKDVLLLDDTWASGGHAQSAAAALLAAGAETVGLVVFGRHVQPSWVVDDQTSADLLAALPRAFDWETCAVHRD